MALPDQAPPRMVLVAPSWEQYWGWGRHSSARCCEPSVDRRRSAGPEPPQLHATLRDACRATAPRAKSASAPVRSGALAVLERRERQDARTPGAALAEADQHGHRSGLPTLSCRRFVAVRPVRSECQAPRARWLSTVLSRRASSGQRGAGRCQRSRCSRRR